VCGRSRREQLNTFVRAVVRAVEDHGEVGMPAAEAAALAALRAFNYERIYVRPESRAQSRAVVEVLQALVEHYVAHPDQLPEPELVEDPIRAAVTYVAGMTDRYAFDKAVADLGWDPTKLPRGISI
jgi:dGTPase